MSIDSGEIGRLIDVLASNDEQECERTCQQLEEIGETAVPSLVEALRRKDWRGRCWIPRVLGSMGAAARSAVPDLIALIERRSSLSAFAAEALGSIGDPSAVPCLIKALSIDDYLGTCAACALGKIGDLRAIGPLISVLQNRWKYWVPRGAAAYALGEIGIGAREALPALEKALRYNCNKGIFVKKWDERVREAVEDAIDRIKGLSKETKLKGRGYRYEMWVIY